MHLVETEKSLRIALDPQIRRGVEALKARTGLPQKDIFLRAVRMVLKQEELTQAMLLETLPAQDDLIETALRRAQERQQVTPLAGIPADLMTELEEHAASRGKTPEALVRELIRAAVRTTWPKGGRQSDEGEGTRNGGPAATLRLTPTQEHRGQSGRKPPQGRGK